MNPGPRHHPARRRLATLGVVVALTSGACGLVGAGGATIRVTAEFPRTVSLYPGSQVRVLGLPAGRVQAITVRGTTVEVVLGIERRVPVPAGAEATIVPFSLIGERYVQLTPAYTGGARLRDGDRIPLSRTHVPVEPDEALRSLRNFLRDLNPEATRRLVGNLARDLDGQGEAINRSIRSIAELTRDFAAKGDAIGRIIDNFDRFTSTLVTREGQLGKVLDEFAALTDLLAQERGNIEAIVRNLDRFAGDARDLVATHAAALDTDLSVLEHVAQSLQANLDSVGKLLDAGPITFTGLKNAYDPNGHLVRLRNNAPLGAPGPNRSSASSASEAAPPPGTPPGTAPAAPPSTAPAPPPPPAQPGTPLVPLDRMLEELVGRTPAGRSLEAPGPPGRRGVADVIIDALGAFGTLARQVVGA